jgi:hypothetical protein
MKRRLAGTLLFLVAVSVGPAAGQFVITPSLFSNSMNLVKSPEIQKDLGVTPEQAKKLAELDKTLAEMLKVPGFPDANLQNKLREAVQKGLAEVLLAPQTKRLKQLEFQQRGSSAFMDPQIAKELEITQEQRAAILKHMQSLGQRWAAAFQAAKGNQQEIQKKLGELQRSIAADCVKELTAKQQEKWRELAGPAYAGNFPTQVFIGNPRPQPVLTWHMNDLNAALAESKATGRPIFVTFRCES